MTLKAENIAVLLGTVCATEEIPHEAFVVGSSSALVLQGLRDSCPVLSVWLEKRHFEALCETHAVTNHPMTDTLVVLSKDSQRVEVREFNPYFEFNTVQYPDVGYPVRVFNNLTLLIQKRFEFSQLTAASASEEEVKQVIQDIRVLNDYHAAKNKVKEVA